ncbi:MAG TPA: ABC transporter substrate-binding protein [Candidatus Ozemobacteraceae bacterium]|nr:ABC transporter substrate-binding protein [Candidatus Ozemobacteraceae bacterium]
MMNRTPPRCFSAGLLRSIITAGLLISVAGMAWAATPWRIGVIGALSGPKTVYGRPHFQGAALAAEEINAAGGIAGRPVELVSADDRGEMGRVGDLMTDLIYRKGVLAVLGSVDSGCTHVAAMMAVKAHVPHLTSVATDPSLTRAGSPWTFRTLADDDRQAAALVDWLRGRGVKTVSLLAGESRYGRMGALIFARRFREKGGTIVGPVFMSATAESASQAVNRGTIGHSQAVVLWMLTPEALHAAAELDRLRFTGIIAGGDGLASPAFYGCGSRAIEGIVVTCPYNADADTPENRAFREAYRSRFGTEADSFAAHAYDTIRLIATAVAALHVDEQLDLAGVRNELQKILVRIHPVKGATGEIAFDVTGNDTRDVRLAECREGRLRILGARE